MTFKNFKILFTNPNTITSGIASNVCYMFIRVRANNSIQTTLNMKAIYDNLVNITKTYLRSKKSSEGEYFK